MQEQSVHWSEFELLFSKTCALPIRNVVLVQAYGDSRDTTFTADSVILVVDSSLPGSGEV